MMGSKSFEAKKLNDNQKFEDIIRLYNDSEQDYNYNEWDYYYYSHALRKKELYKEALKLCIESKNRYEKFNLINKDYFWCLYYIYIRNFNSDKDNEVEFLKAAHEIIELSEQNKYSPYERTVWKIINYYETKMNKPYGKIDYYLEKLNVNLLSKEPKHATIDDNDREVSSDKEKWYSLKSKVLFKIEKYEECIIICRQALASLDKLHSDNDIWFRYRDARSHIALGKLDIAESILDKLVLHKEHWVLFDALFLVHREKQNINTAIKYASMAALASGEHKHKVELYENFAEVLKENNYVLESYYHILLIKKIRECNQWKVSKELNEKIKNYNEKDLDERTLTNNMKKFWIENRFKDETIIKGTVDNILPNGKAGFIKDSKGKSFYFKISSVRGKKENIKKGTTVSFYIKKSYDKRKNCISDEAIEVNDIKQ